MIVLFTDFGLAGPYTGQVKAVLHRDSPGVAVIDLFADAPMRDPRTAAYLLAAYAPWFPHGTVFLAVVDPGVGGDRAPLVVSANGHWFVGPDNGLFELVLRRAREATAWEITWRPERLSTSFHGRDLFAPVAAMLARGETPAWRERSLDSVRHADWPDDLAVIVYLDHYGNAMTGLRARMLPPGTTLLAGDGAVRQARTFADAPPGTPFWYENSCGLAEIAVNLGHAGNALGLAVGTTVTVDS